MPLPDPNEQSASQDADLKVFWRRSFNAGEDPLIGVVRDAMSQRRCLSRVQNAVLCAAMGLSFAGCTSMRVPRSIPNQGGSDVVSTTADGITVKVKPIVGREGYWELFDDNLPEIGIVAAWISIRNDRPDEVLADPKRWYLLSGSIASRRLRSTEVIDHYHKARKIRMYTVKAEQEACGRLDDIGLKPGRLPPAGSAEGFLFFRTAGPADASWHRHARVIMRGLFSGKERRKEIVIPLYADR